MKRAFKILLRLYPADHRALFAAEMLTVFEEAAEARRRQGSAVFVRFALAELIGLVAGAGAEWVAKFAYGVYHSNSYITGRCLPDPGLMRPAGVSRQLHSAAPTRAFDHFNRGDMCANAHQKFVTSSPLRRLLIFTCQAFLPAHPRNGAKARIWNHHD